ncbi:hypothetical protein DSO57_1011831 [Entomophthora muscae]|uniref:Uncharacterized protein n=1 Tax=Entomophthora muscae TaxID=34485 RepID=A0ACC2UQZ4_9FUNG|nr:hypothetical protein DSO57_1011831 [Entomophthora muscae]
MSFPITKKKPAKLSKEKPKKPDNVQVPPCNYDRQLQSLFDETRDMFKLPSNPLSPTQDGSKLALVEGSLDSPTSTASQTSTAQSSIFGEISDGSNSPTQRLNILEIDNYYLTEQNRLLKKELINNKFNVEAVKKVVTQKEVHLIQIQNERYNLETRVKELQNYLDWVKSNVDPSILAACPFPSSHPSSSISLTPSESSDISLSGKPEEMANNEDSKPKKRPDSITFMRGLFKFNAKNKQKPRDGNDEWINCEDEEIEADGLKSSPLFNPPLNTPNLSKPAKRPTKIFSALRFSSASNSSITSPPLPPTGQLVREELRSQIFSRPSPPASPRKILPNTVPSGSIVISDTPPEDDPSEIDIESELAAFDFDSSDQDSVSDTPPISGITMVNEVNKSPLGIPNLSYTPDNSAPPTSSGSSSSDSPPYLQPLPALPKKSAAESSPERHLSLPPTRSFIQEFQDDLPLSSLARTDFNIDASDLFNISPTYPFSPPGKNAFPPPTSPCPAFPPKNQTALYLPSPPEALQTSPTSYSKSSTSFLTIKKSTPLRRRSSASARPLSMSAATSRTNTPIRHSSLKASKQPLNPHTFEAQTLHVAQ